jgi:hypothetical protein
MNHQAALFQPGHFRQGSCDSPQQIFLFERHDEALSPFARRGGSGTIKPVWFGGRAEIVAEYEIHN